MLKYLIYPILALSLLSFKNINALNKGKHTSESNPLQENTQVNYNDWTAQTHSKKAEPDYSVIFEQNKVLRFDITIDSLDWANMQTDLSSVLGSNEMRPKRPNSTGNPPPKMPNSTDSNRQDRPSSMGGSPPNTPPTASSKKPIWVPCSFHFEGKEWYHVGLRYKGNSSLRSAYQSNNKKLSLKLDFDEFEDDYPALKNQRFYGFKQLNLNNNYDDASLMREKVGADLFRQFGLAAAQTTFCVIYIDYGTGPQYYGVYTLVEEVDNTVISSQFNDNSGNLYKPDGDAASFAAGTYNESQFELKTNKDSANYSDMKALYDILQNSSRSSDTDTWKSELETIFDVNTYLKWLAANTVIQNWDTYGSMPHNFYLYNNPDNNLLTWIPWDNNEAFQSGKKGGNSSFNYYETDSSWPLIDYILNIDQYKKAYDSYLQQFIDEVFIPSDMVNTYESYYTLLKDYAYDEKSDCTFIRSDTDFDNAVSTLKTHVQKRNNALNTYLK